MDKNYLKNKIKPFIEKVIPTLEKNNGDVRKSEKGSCVYYSKSFANNTMVRAKTFPERELIFAPIKFLNNQKIFSEKYSENYLETSVMELYHKILKDKSKIDSLIQELCFQLLNFPAQKYLVLSGLENMRILDDSAYEIVDCIFKILKKEDFPLKKDSIILTHDLELIGKPAIITQVLAGDVTKATELALHNYTIAFNLLKVYAPDFKPVLDGCMLTGHQRLLVYGANGEALPHHHTVGDSLLRNAYLDKKLYKQLKEAGIDELKKPTSISQVIKECLYWFGLGLDEKYPSARLIDFVTVLESTLKKKSETTELRKIVSERGSIFLYETFEQRKEARNQLKEIYDTRSKVVHTGALINDKNIASLAGGYAKSVLTKLIDISKYFKGDFESFIDHLDDVKLGKKSNIYLRKQKNIRKINKKK